MLDRTLHSDATKNRALALYASGLSIRTVALRLRRDRDTVVSPQTVARWARLHGLARPVGERRRITLGAEAKRLYESGLILEQVAMRLGVGKTTVAKRLREMGCAIRPSRIVYGHRLTADRLLKLYVQQDLRAQEIAQRFHCSTGTVYGWLHRNHVPLKRKRHSGR